MSSERQRASTTAERPLEWMRFDPVKFGLLVDGCTLEEEGAFMRVIRHLWNRGHLPEAEVKRICRGAFEVVRAAMFEVDGHLSLEIVEDARTHGKRRVAQRVEAGIASAAKRNERSTTVEREPTTVPTGVLSNSLSSSPSGKNGKERAPEKFPFDAFWIQYPKKDAKQDAQKAWAKLKDPDREACIARTPAFVASKEDKKFLPYGATYLNGRRWEDEIVTFAPAKPMTKADAYAALNAIRKANNIPDGGNVGPELMTPELRSLIFQ